MARRPVTVAIRLLPAALAVAAVALPLWVVMFNAPMFGGSWLTIYVHGYGGVEGPIDQVNIANHYVGLRPIEPDGMVELRILPYLYVVAGLLLVLRAHGRARRLSTIAYIILLVSLPAYIQYWLYEFGHEIRPGAAIRIEPFTPYALGYFQVANFKVISFFHVGYWVLVLALVLSRVVEKRFGG